MKNKKKSSLLFLVLSLFSGAIFYFGWTPQPLWFVLLFAFVPLLWIENEIIKQKFNKSNVSVFLFSFLTFLSWNVTTTWWVGNTTVVASGIIAFVLNALLMCTPFLLFHITHKKLGDRLGYISLPVFWIVFEFLHLRWELSWPWLTLGNGLASFPEYIQWYEYTGVLGGTLWIWVSNILIFIILKNIFNQQSSVKSFYKKFELEHVSVLVIWVAVPLAISMYMYQHVIVLDYHKTGQKQVVIVQPNIDPYNEKFDESTLDMQVQKLLGLSSSLVNTDIDYLVWPETAIAKGMLEDELPTNDVILNIRQFMRDYPKLELVTGINGYLKYDSAATITARKFDDGGCCYDAFNSALQFDLNGNFQVYHKSKLVPGVEAMPYPWLFKFLEPLSKNMEGISGSLGKQNIRSVFYSKDKTGIAPVICYESVYGEYVAEYVRNGANLIFIITNDGWWGDTPGHIQHLHYASLRAIETRRCIARSANTGTSCFIDVKGNIIKPTKYGESTVIKSFLSCTDKLTFYVQYGDYIGRIAMAIAAWILIYLLIKRKINGSEKSL